MTVRRGQKPIPLGNDIYMIDLMEQNLPCRSAAFVILDKEITVVETGSALSHDVLVQGLADLGVTPQQLSYVVVTHVHLDHAGGAGHLMEVAPNAKLVVHPRGARHMVDPSRLWNGAKEVYGDGITSLFGSIKPVPESQILIRNHEETLQLGERTLTFFDSPGHAKHHFTALDSKAAALYAGDAVGIRYRTCFTGWDFEFILPSTSPVDFDPSAVKRTADLVASLPCDVVYHTHFGPSDKSEAVAATVAAANAWAELIDRVYQEGVSQATVERELRRWISSRIDSLGHCAPSDLSILDIDVVLDAMGLIVYESRRRSELG